MGFDSQLCEVYLQLMECELPNSIGTIVFRNSVSYWHIVSSYVLRSSMIERLST